MGETGTAPDRCRSLAADRWRFVVLSKILLPNFRLGIFKRCCRGQERSQKHRLKESRDASNSCGEHPRPQWRPHPTLRDRVYGQWNLSGCSPQLLDSLLLAMNDGRTRYCSSLPRLRGMFEDYSITLSCLGTISPAPSHSPIFGWVRGAPPKGATLKQVASEQENRQKGEAK